MAKTSKQGVTISRGRPAATGKVVGRQLNGLSVAGKSTRRMLPKSSPSASVSPEGVHTPVSGQGLRRQNRRGRAASSAVYVPVISGDDRKPLMPTTPSRARRWIERGEATPYWNHGVFCVRLNRKPSGRLTQPVACGIDPGSKKEGLTVRDASRTFLNVQADAVTWVSRAVEIRRNARLARRSRKTPFRKPRRHRKGRRKGRGLTPSGKARWQWKIRLARWLARLYPISIFVVEDVKAKSRKGQRRWNVHFSPLEIGKNWFYEELGLIAPVKIMRGWETKALRDKLGLKKTHRKTASVFEAHCVDSWILAVKAVGGTEPDNKDLLLVTPIRFNRRQLHMLQPAKGGIRRRQGGTRSMGFKRGSLVRHPKYGLCYVGGTSERGLVRAKWVERISLHSLVDGKRVCDNAKPEECVFLTYLSFRARTTARAA